MKVKTGDFEFEAEKFAWGFMFQAAFIWAMIVALFKPRAALSILGNLIKKGCELSVDASIKLQTLYHELHINDLVSSLPAVAKKLEKWLQICAIFYLIVLPLVCGWAYHNGHEELTAGLLVAGAILPFASAALLRIYAFIRPLSYPFRTAAIVFLLLAMAVLVWPQGTGAATAILIIVMAACMIGSLVNSVSRIGPFISGTLVSFAAAGLLLMFFVPTTRTWLAVKLAGNQAASVTQDEIAFTTKNTLPGIASSNGYLIPTQGSNINFNKGQVFRILGKIERGVKLKNGIPNHIKEGFEFPTGPIYEVCFADSLTGELDLTRRGYSDRVRYAPGLLEKWGLVPSAGAAGDDSTGARKQPGPAEPEPLETSTPSDYVSGTWIDIPAEGPIDTKLDVQLNQSVVFVSTGPWILPNWNGRETEKKRMNGRQPWTFYHGGGRLIVHGAGRPVRLKIIV